MKAIMRNKEEMKDSGIEWYERVPNSWCQIRLKDVYDFEKGKNAQIYTKDYIGLNQGIYPVYSGQTESGGIMGYINSYDYDLDECLFSTTVGAKVMTARILMGKFSLSQNCLIMNRCGDINNHFVFYMLHPLFEYEKSMIPTYMQPSLRIEDLKQYRFYAPILKEQQAIATYLDDRCSKIDAIIAEAKASIEEYKELKQAVIYEAVTKGLDKNVEMMDSGVEWLGSIPSQWNLVKTNRIIDNTQNGLTRRDLDKSDGQIVLKLKNINAEGEIDYSDTNRIQLTDDEIEKYRLHNEDLLFVRVNGSRDLVGKCAIFEEKDEAIAYNDHIIRVKLNDYCIPEFVKWYLLCDSGKSEIALKINTAAGQFTISGEGLRAIYMPLPSLNEQRNIVEFLNVQTKKIDFVINEKQSLIEDLESYKKSLIYEVVTGKRKVVE